MFFPGRLLRAARLLVVVNYFFFAGVVTAGAGVVVLNQGKARSYT